jgi:signal transduction histidine kinase
VAGLTGLASMAWTKRWNNHSLALQFLITGGCVSLVAALAVGIFVSHLIEDAVTQNSAAATALYVDSVIAPLLPDMRSSEVLDDTTARALDETLDQGALGQRLMSFRLWRSDGTVLYSKEKDLIGKRFEPNPKLKVAFSGKMVSKYEHASDPESQAERSLGKPLLEIYNPVLQPWSGQVVAVSEFYEVADGLQQTLVHARLQSWLAVAGSTIAFFLILSALVFRGSRIINEQRSSLRERVSDLSDLLAQNEKLHRNIQRASQRAVAMNESYLRKIGADLHDGPAQLIAYASLRLDSNVILGSSATKPQRQEEARIIQASLADAMTELRSISRGLVLPQIESATLFEIVARAIRAHEERTDTVVKHILPSEDPQLTTSGKICVFRFVQEALNNAYRHGQGRGQAVHVIASGQRLELMVKDEGSGFDPGLVRPESLGLAGLRDRVESLGGSFKVETSAAGTTVRMTLGAMEVERA